MEAIRKLLMIVTATATLSGCAIPDLVAHAVKSYQQPSSSAAAEPARPAATPAAYQAEPPPPPAPTPVMRDSVTVEQLPPPG